MGVLISASLAGSVVSLIPWGLAADRVGERWVLLAGVGGCGLALLAASQAGSFEALLLLLVLAGFLGASVQSASGRAVMAWFPGSQRGLALGIRQTAIPISGFAAVARAAADRARGRHRLGIRGDGDRVRHGARSSARSSCARSRRRTAQTTPTSQPLRDRRIWRISVGSALVVAPQMCVVGFTVLFLHDRRGLSPGHAAAVLARRPAARDRRRASRAGRWSDVVGSRLRPLRLIALAVVVFVAGSAALLSAPLVVLIPALVVAGVLSMSWNGLSFAAAVELAGHRRSGAAIGLQQIAAERQRRGLSRPVRRARRRDLVVVRVRRVRRTHARGLARPPSIAGVSTRALERIEAVYAIAQHRAAYSPEEDAAHELAAGWMRDAGSRGHARRRGQPLRVAR